MEPIRHTLTARLGYLKMYREELDELVAMFQRSCGKVTVSDLNYRYESLEEMRQTLPPRIRDLDIRGENPGVRFLLNQIEVTRASSSPMQTVFNELRTEEITDAADVLFYKLKDFLVAHQQPNFRKGFIGAIASVIGAFWFALHHAGVNKAGDITLGSKPGFAICMAAFVIFVVAGANVTNYLSLETKRNSASFFVRNWE